jgi:hypothetical protein
MSSITSVLVGISLMVASPVSATNTIIEQTIDYAKKMRIDSTLSPEVEAERVLALAQEAASKLPVYPGEKGLDKAVEALLSDAVGPYSFKLVDIRTTGFQGKSSDRLFLIYDQQGNLSYVAKLFTNFDKLKFRFFHELSANQLFKELKLPGVAPIEPIALAQCDDGVQKWGMFLMAAAPGKTLLEWLSDKPEKFEKALARLGESLALLHQTKAGKPSQLAETAQMRTDKFLADILASPFIISRIEKHFSPQALIDYVGYLKSEANRVPLYCSLEHGDPNLGNVFYDEKTDLISFIDSSKMHSSLDLQGQPLVDGAADLIRVEKNVIRRCLGRLSDQQAQDYMSVFYKAYEKTAGQLPDERLIAYYRGHTALDRLQEYCRYKDQTDPDLAAYEKLVFDDALNYLSQLIGKLPVGSEQRQVAEGGVAVNLNIQQADLQPAQLLSIVDNTKL